MRNKLGSRENASEFAIFLELENEKSFYFLELYFVFFNYYKTFGLKKIVSKTHQIQIKNSNFGRETNYCS